jgi:hypothetical protein
LAQVAMTTAKPVHLLTIFVYLNLSLTVSLASLSGFVQLLLVVLLLS